MDIYKWVEPKIKIIGRILLVIFICFVAIFLGYTTFFALKANITGKPVKYNFLGTKSIFIPYDNGYDNPGWHLIR